MMKMFLELGDNFAKNSNWKDFALTKICLFSMGIAVGTHVPQKQKKVVFGLSVLGFLSTYIILMAKLVRIALGKETEE